MKVNTGGVRYEGYQPSASPYRQGKSLRSYYEVEPQKERVYYPQSIHDEVKNREIPLNPPTRQAIVPKSYTEAEHFAFDPILPPKPQEKPKAISQLDRNYQAAQSPKRYFQKEYDPAVIGGVNFPTADNYEYKNVKTRNSPHKPAEQFTTLWDESAHFVPSPPRACPKSLQSDKGTFAPLDPHFGSVQNGSGSRYNFSAKDLAKSGQLFISE